MPLGTSSERPARTPGRPCLPPKAITTEASETRRRLTQGADRLGTTGAASCPDQPDRLGLFARHIPAPTYRPHRPVLGGVSRESESAFAYVCLKSWCPRFDTARQRSGRRIEALARGSRGQTTRDVHRSARLRGSGGATRSPTRRDPLRSSRAANAVGAGHQHLELAKNSPETRSESLTSFRATNSSRARQERSPCKCTRSYNLRVV